MKSALISISLLVMLSTPLTGQPLLPFGFSLGAVSAQQQWDYAPQSSVSNQHISGIWGFDIGLIKPLVGANSLTLQVEAHYIQKGRTVTARQTVPANNPQGFIDLGEAHVAERFHYLSVPFVAKLRLPFETASPFFCIGPSFEYLVSRPSSAMFDRFRRTELSASVSAGVEISLSTPFTVSPELRYTRALTNMFRNENVTVTNRSLEILLGVNL